MHNYTSSYRLHFITKSETYKLVNAPIGYNEIDLDLKRSKKTDGIVLDISQANKFVGVDRVKLTDYRELLGADGKVMFRIEKNVFNTWEIIEESFIELTSIKESHTDVSVDFVDNDFDAVFRSNIKEEFEANRTETLDGNVLADLIPKTYRHKSKPVLKKSKLVSVEFAENYAASTFVIPLMDIDYSNMAEVQSVIGFSTLATSSRMFINNSEEDRSLTIDLDVEYLASNYDNAVILIQKYNNGESYDIVDETQLAFSSVSGANLIYAVGGLQVDLLAGESLALGAVVYSFDAFDFETVRSNVLITENSIYTPTEDEIKIDCITFYDAFKRLINIMDSTVVFKSDYITNNWKSLILFSGETLRHVKYNDELAPLATLSFQDLFDAAFTAMGGIGFGIRKQGNSTIFEIEELAYFFDNDIETDIGVLKDVTIEDNLDKIFTSVKVGYNNSGDIEEVTGLLATHTVNEYKLPVNSKENEYDATCDFIAEPNEIELTFRKQYSSFPDTDTKLDDNIIVIDAHKSTYTKGVYLAHEWQDHFSSVSGVTDINSSYNYRLSPMNCLLRHSENFTQEFTSAFYDDKSLSYLSTAGNVQLSTTLIGGVERKEDGSISMTDFNAPLYGNKIVKGKTSADYNTVKQIKGGLYKRNYYGKFKAKDESGNLIFGFMSSIKIGKSMSVELFKTN